MGGQHIIIVKHFMQQQRSNKQGFVTLFSLIILMIISIAVFSSILLVNVDSLRSVEAVRQGIIARSLANTCAEVALNKLKDDNNYQGNESLTLTSGSCEILSISGSGNTNRIIRTTGNANQFIRKSEIKVTTLNPSTDIDYWREIDF